MASIETACLPFRMKVFIAHLGIRGKRSNAAIRSKQVLGAHLHLRKRHFLFNWQGSNTEVHDIQSNKDILIGRRRNLSCVPFHSYFVQKIQITYCSREISRFHEYELIKSFGE